MAINQDAEVLYSAEGERCLPLFSLRIQQKDKSIPKLRSGEECATNAS